jgi:hypothetical protein
LRKELSKIDENAAPDDSAPQGFDPVRHACDSVVDEVLCHRDLMMQCIRSFVVNELAEVDDKRSRDLLRVCGRWHDSPLTVLLDLYGENNEKEIVERLLGLRTIES